MTARFVRCLRHSVAALVVYVLFSPSEASAKFFLITTGETISDVGSGKDGNKSVKIGYKYDYAGLFWIDFWTWGGEYCVYEGTNFRQAPQPQRGEPLIARLHHETGKCPGMMQRHFAHQKIWCFNGWQRSESRHGRILTTKLRAWKHSLQTGSASVRNVTGVH